jgi:type II secretory pathway pseudopilin PulG
MRLICGTPKQCPHTPLAGFSLVEAMVGMAILGTTMGALLSGFASGFFTMRMTRENLRATQIMLEKMETIRLYSWDQVNTPGFIPPTFSAPYDPQAAEGRQGLAYHGTLTITDVPSGAIDSSYAPYLKKVVVTVNWTTCSLNRTRQFQSYISRYGLQDYVY